MLQKPCELGNLRSCPPGIFSNINRAMYFRVHINDFRTDSLGRFPITRWKVKLILWLPSNIVFWSGIITQWKTHILIASHGRNNTSAHVKKLRKLNYRFETRVCSNRNTERQEYSAGTKHFKRSKNTCGKICEKMLNWTKNFFVSLMVTWLDLVKYNYLALH